MITEERILFPVMRSGGVGIENPITVIRADHADHAEKIALIRKLSHGWTPPDHAFGWSSLHACTATLPDELAALFALENDVLSPRFARAA